jgi:hypothetical protein
MRRHTCLPALLLLPPLLCLSGCAGPSPSVERGTFTGEKSFQVRRGLSDVTVQTDGEATYVLRQYPNAHPMGPPGDTECVVTTPAGTFTIEDRDLERAGLRINGTYYEFQRPPDGGHMKLLIDREGNVKVVSPKEPAAR